MLVLIPQKKGVSFAALHVVALLQVGELNWKPPSLGGYSPPNGGQTQISSAKQQSSPMPRKLALAPECSSRG